MPLVLESSGYAEKRKGTHQAAGEQGREDASRGGVDDDHYPHATQPIVRCALLDCGRDLSRIRGMRCWCSSCPIVSWLMMRVDCEGDSAMEL